jgi:hypothetical protein
MFALQTQTPAPLSVFLENTANDNFHASSSGRDDDKAYFGRDAFMAA